MATRDLAEWHDQESGDDIHYRDKELVDATEAESANDLTSEWEVLLKSGQTGKLKTAMMSYIDQKVREAMGALVNNLDKGASISKVLATDANNDLGTITPANLASVLSAALGILYPSNTITLKRVVANETIIGTGVFFAGAYYQGCTAIYSITHKTAFINGQATNGAMKIWGEDVSIITDGYTHTYPQGGFLIMGLGL